MAFVAVTRSAGIRSAVEDVIRGVYWDRYAARLPSFPSILLAEVNPSGLVECAAGLRFGCQGLFSERYLDLPVEHILSHRFRRRVDRDRVVEVCHLVAPKPGRSRPFIRNLIEFAKAADAECAIFTATRTLRVLLQRGGLSMTELTRAVRGRVETPADWGNYYDHDPRVMLVGSDVAVAHKRSGFAAEF